MVLSLPVLLGRNDANRLQIFIDSGGLKPMNKTNRKIRGMCLGIVFLALAAPASADMMCFAGNLSGLLGTTCDIGNLEFNFNRGFSGFNSVTGTPWSASDFFLTPVPYGFTISFAGGPQSITG